IIEYAVFIADIRRLELSVFLAAEPEGHASVDDRLAAHDVEKILIRYVYIGKDLEVWFPMYCRACLFPVGSFFFQPAYVLAFFKMQAVFAAVSPHRDVHELRR